MNGKRVSLNSADLHRFCAKRVIRPYHFPFSGSRLAGRAGISHLSVRRISGRNNSHSFTLVIYCSRFDYLEIEFISRASRFHHSSSYFVCRSAENGWPRAEPTKNKKRKQKYVLLCYIFFTDGARFMRADVSIQMSRFMFLLTASVLSGSEFIG